MNRYPSGSHSHAQPGGRMNTSQRAAAAPCAPDVSVLVPLPMAMAYVPMQVWGETYSCEKALQRGTLFPILYLPFCKGGGAQ